MAKKRRSSAAGSRKRVSKTDVSSAPPQKRQVSIGRGRRAWAVMARSMRIEAARLNGTDGPPPRDPSGTSGGASDDAHDLGGLAPQALEAVELALLGGEDVDDHRAVVEQDPAGGGAPLGTERPDALLA